MDGWIEKDWWSLRMDGWIDKFETNWKGGGLAGRLEGCLECERFDWKVRF